MKALSIWQPWAQLLAVGVKHDETRSWRMEKPVLFKEPIPAAGKQGLWNWDGELPELLEV